MEFERVVNGVVRYLNAKVFKSMNDWQQLIARFAVSRVLGNADKVKTALSNNAFVRTFGIIDERGNVDIDGLFADIKKVVEEKGKISFALPMFGNFTFYASDVDELRQCIVEG